MKIKNKNTKDSVFIIAEIGNNHEGSIELAKEMVYQIAETGADAVKFQTFKTESFISIKEKKRFDQLKSFELKYQDFVNLSNVASDLDLKFISTPLDLQSAVFLSEIVDAIKISSGDNNFVQLLKLVSRFDIPIILSSGMLNMDELKIIIDGIQYFSSNRISKENFSILHCVSSYPVEPKSANLKAIKALSSAFDFTVGYSDHTMGINASLSAVALGARIIEKHFTIDKNHSDFRDHKLSVNFDEMKHLVNSIREIEQMLGEEEKIIQNSEKQIINSLRRSIVAKKDLSIGKTITKKDITFIRPGGGLNPSDEKKIVGKKLKYEVKKGDKLLFNHLE